MSKETYNHPIRSRTDKLARTRRDDLRREFLIPFDRIFDEFFNWSFPDLQAPFGGDLFEKGAYPKVDIRDYSDKSVIEAAIPGINKEDISIEIDNGVLTISGTAQAKSYAPEDEQSTYLYRELKRSSFKRSWTLNENVDVAKISAKFENGMLFLTIPKLKPDGLKEVPIKIEIK